MDEILTSIPEEFVKTYLCVNSNNEVVAMSAGFRIAMDGCETKEVDGFLDHSNIDGYIWQDNEVVFSEERYQRRQHENKQWDLRNKRDTECFSIINRGDAWYQMYVTTDERKQELAEWYNAWLDVTETMVEPEKPSWIE